MTSVKPASDSIRRAVSVPHIAPSAAPPRASVLGTQNIVLIAYDIGAYGLPTLSSTALANFASTITNTPSGASTSRTRRSTVSGRCWSWIASKASTTS